MKRFPFLTILMSFMLAACNVTPMPDLEATVQAAIMSTQTSQSTTTPLPTTTAIPIPTMTPTPTQTPMPTPTATASTSSQTGVVCGVLLDETTGQPVANEEVALGKVVERGEDGKIWHSISWNGQGKLERSAYTDSMGGFTIKSPPGTYVLLTSPGDFNNQKIARVSGVLLIIELAPGQTTDLGRIYEPP